MRKRHTRRWYALFAVTAAVALALLTASAATLTRSSASTVHPLNNDASAGKVILTFDDGPDIYDAKLLATLKVLHLHAIFFVIGDKITPSERSVIKAELAAGDLVENHTWDHADWTGASTHTTPLTDAQVSTELTKTNAAIVAAGAPKPTLARAPFGDLTGQYAIDAANLHLQMTQPFEINPSYAPRIVDSNDWTSINSTQIVTDVTQGSNGFPGINGGSIAAFHDAAPGSCTKPTAADKPLCNDALSTIESLQGIVSYMNAHHLGNTTAVTSDATGGILGRSPWNWLPKP